MTSPIPLRHRPAKQQNGRDQACPPGDSAHQPSHDAVGEQPAAVGQHGTRGGVQSGLLEQPFGGRDPRLTHTVRVERVQGEPFGEPQLQHDTFEVAIGVGEHLSPRGRGVAGRQQGRVPRRMLHVPPAHSADVAVRARAQARRGLDSELRRAFAENEFELYFQPEIRLLDGAVVGAEALLRWRHPERGILAPWAFIETLADSSIAPDVPVTRIMWGTIPYVACMMLAIVILCIFPEIATWLPDHLMGVARK